MNMPTYLQEHDEDIRSLHDLVKSIDMNKVPSDMTNSFHQLKDQMDKFVQGIQKMTETQFFATLEVIKEAFLGLILSLTPTNNASA